MVIENDGQFINYEIHCVISGINLFIDKVIIRDNICEIIRDIRKILELLASRS